MSFTRKELAELRSRFFDRMAVIGSVTAVADEMGVSRHTASGWARKAGLRSKRVPDPKQADYLALRRDGQSQASAARQVGVHVRTCRDWEYGVVKNRTRRRYADGRVVDYTTGEVTMGEVVVRPCVSLAAVERELDPRFPHDRRARTHR